MGGMNQEEKEDMARYILDVNQQWGTTVILIEHDMAVVMDISDHVTVLDRGRKIAEGSPGRGAAQPGGDPRLSRRRPENAREAADMTTAHDLAALVASAMPSDGGAAGAARKGPRHLADLQLGAVLRGGARFCAGAGRAWLPPRRQAVGDRRQPPAPLLGAARRASLGGIAVPVYQDSIASRARAMC